MGIYYLQFITVEGIMVKKLVKKNTKKSSKKSAPKFNKYTAKIIDAFEKISAVPENLSMKKKLEHFY